MLGCSHTRILISVPRIDLSEWDRRKASPIAADMLKSRVFWRCLAGIVQIMPLIRHTLPESVLLGSGYIFDSTSWGSLQALHGSMRAMIDHLGGTLPASISSCLGTSLPTRRELPAYMKSEIARG